MTQPLRSARITRLQRYYELLRPCAPHRYSRSHAANHLNFSLRIGTTGSRSAVIAINGVLSTSPADRRRPDSRRGDRVVCTPEERIAAAASGEGVCPARNHPVG